MCLKSNFKPAASGSEEGVVLITSLLILALISAMGLSASYLANTEVIIAGNLETETRSVYIAEGGLEIAKNELNTSAFNNFTIAGTSNVSMKGFTYSSNCDTNPSVPCRTITRPLNWVSAGWNEYDSSAGSCTATAISGLSAFPVCRNLTVGNETALVVIGTPYWVPSNPTKIVFQNITSKHTSNSPNKMVEASMEIDFGPNLAAFQELRDQNDPTGQSKDQIDNVTSPTQAILSRTAGYEYAMGGTGNNDRISGIYTGGSKIKIQYCLSTTTIVDCDTSNTWKDLGIPATAPGNNSFILANRITTTVGPATNINKNDCFYTSARDDIGGFPSLPIIVLNPEFSGYHLRIVAISNTTDCL